MYEISEIYPAIQGESYHAGTPCTIVRMQGCNLRCSFCDTAYAQQPGLLEKWPLDDLLKKIEDKLTPSKVVLITGGEPLLQDLKPLTENLLARKIKIHLETNGSVDIKHLDTYFDHISMSPKQSRYATKLRKCDDLKLLYPWIHEDITYKNFSIYKTDSFIIQPIEDENYKQNLKEAEKYVLNTAKNGLRLGIQVHKILGAR